MTDNGPRFIEKLSDNLAGWFNQRLRREGLFGGGAEGGEEKLPGDAKA